MPATVKYFTKGNNPTSTIYIRFSHGRKFDFKKSTTLSIESKYWNNSKGIVRSVAEFGDKLNFENTLNGLRAYLINKFNTDYSNGTVIDAQWLSLAINKHFNQSDEHDFNFLTDYAQHFIDSLPYRVQRNGTTGLAMSTIRKYKSTLQKIHDFEKHTGKRLKTNNIDLKFHNDFIKFMSNNQQLNLNTIGKYIKCLKTILKNAKQFGLKVHPEVEFDGFRSTKEKTYFVTLNQDEIETIFNLDLSDSPYLENARNWLIIGVWTGARVSDLLNFTSDNINNGFIEYQAQKTKQKIMLPVHWQVQSIIEGNNGQFPRKISNQRYNDWIKEISKKAGIVQLCKGAIYLVDPDKKGKKIKTPQRKVLGNYPKWKLVSTHTARRSFATNHYGKLPTPIIMSVTGHTTEKMLLAYIGKTPQDNAILLKDFWAMENIKGKKEIQLEIVKTAN
ncbi:MAG: phage integrase SAM-like domain-containing protein [Maribacter arcticus]|uniref:phage integrase SAM-like domain-containing protein n=1 Tax=Maribacter arcticus TaxID=561365 RepID=UPI0030031B06